MSRLTKTYDTVIHQLRRDEKYRDNDNLLVVKIWWHELENLGYDPKNLSAYDFMCLYRDDKLTVADTITRARRKAQENFPELRGKSYEPRQQETEAVKQELKLL